MGSGDRRVHGAFVQCEGEENSNPEASRVSRPNERVCARGGVNLSIQKKGAASGSLGKRL